MDDSQTMYQALHFLQPDDFHHTGHRIAFTAAVGLFTKQQAIDPVSIAQEIRAQGNDVRGTVYSFLTKLREIDHNIEHVPDYTRIVADSSTRRHTIETAQKLITTAQDGANTAYHTIQFAMQELLKFGYRASQHGTLMPLATLYDQYIESRLNPSADTDPPGIETGYNALDGIISAMQPSNLVILGARPSIGKSSLALNIGINAAYGAATVESSVSKCPPKKSRCASFQPSRAYPPNPCSRAAFPPRQCAGTNAFAQQLVRVTLDGADIKLMFGILSSSPFVHLVIRCYRTIC